MGFSRGGSMRRSSRVVAVLTGFLTLCLWAAGEIAASSPALGVIMPRGVQRGTESVLTFSGGQLGDAQEIFFYSPGFEVTKIEAKDANNIAATVKVAADCRLGEHVAQVRTKSGISDYRTFYVGALPIVDEKEPNSDFAAPQKIALNVTVHGVIDNEDVDYFVVDAKKGQRIAVEIEAMRLGMTLCDPYVAILDAKRFELAAKDDSPLLLQDAAATIVAPADGPYIVQVRDSAYGGNGSCNYRVHIGTFPRPTGVYPAGGKIGEEIEVRFLGDAAGEFTAKYKLPAAVEEDYGLLAAADGVVAPSENSFRLSEQPNVLEVEPNNAPAQSTSAQLPLAFNGVIGVVGDVDFFKFTAKKGEVYEIDCFARRLRSPLDSVMYIHNAAGTALVGNDDAKNKDSYFRFTFPEDGEYLLQVTDHLGRGGPDYVYRVEFTPVKPTLTVQIPRVARYSQYRQQIYVPKGNRFATLINVARSDFGGPIMLEPKDLPQGITMVAQEMPANMDLMPVVFEAAADAPLSGKLVDFRARHSDANTKI
ncbi:MAG: PPC domain-containing protein, partial [Planctomycetaceae bacterium]